MSQQQPQLPSDIVERLRSTRSLPTMPGIAVKLVDLCRRDDVPLSEVTTTLQGDPALAAKILRFANSAYIGMRSPVTTLTTAVSLLGLINVRTIALSFSLVIEMQRRGFDSRMHRQYWRRSLFSAVAARSLARSMGLPLAEEAFVAALLQDIGVLAMQQVMGDEYAELVAASGGDHGRLVAAERAKYGWDHSAISAWMASEWRLPDLFERGARCSHAGHSAQVPWPSDSLARAVALSGMVADIWTESGDVAVASAAAEQAAARCGIDAVSLAQVLIETANEVPSVASLVNADPGNPAAIQRILDDARESLLALTMRSTEEKQRLQEENRRDGLTGLWNRAHVESILEDAFHQSVVRREPLSVVFLDIDHFKKVNDRFGHSAGDKVLRHVAETVQSCVRESDAVGRYGGEEFIVVLPRATSQVAERLADRIRERVAQHPVAIGPGGPVQVTVSLGCSSLGSRAYTRTDELVKDADEAMYEAKRAGRNRVNVCRG